MRNIALGVFGLLLSVQTVFSGDYYTYKLFNHFQVVAPHEPVEMPDGPMGIKWFIAKDESKSIAFTMKNNNSGLKYDVGEYKQSTQKDIDYTVTEPLKMSGFEIISFTSDFDRRKNTYVATVIAKPKEKGSDAFRAIKQIIKGKQTYIWTVMSYNLSDTQSIFNGYQDYVKVVD